MYGLNKYYACSFLKYKNKYYNQKVKESGYTGENLFLALTDVCIKLTV